MGAGGLKTLLSSLNIPHPYKDDFNKKCMENEINKPTFLFYIIADVLQLTLIPKRMTEEWNEVYKVLNFPERDMFVEENIPLSTGCIVADMVEKFLFNSFADRKRLEKVHNNLGISENIVRGMKKQKKISKLIHSTSIRNIVSLSSKSTSIIGALVQGGRTNNEQPWKYTDQYIVDLDFSSCYGTAMEKFSVGIGYPTIIAFTANEKERNERMTLEEFLNKYEKELLPNLYTITISGNLSFRQNLLYSKVIEAQKFQQYVEKKYEESDDLENNVGKLLLLEKEIINGIITSDILYALKNICTNIEWNEFKKKMIVETALFYKASDKIEKEEEFLKILEKVSEESFFSYDLKTKSCQDKRPTCWMEISLHNLVNPLKTQREIYKKLMKESKDPEKKFYYENKQKTLKKAINTIYGISACPLFEISNAILANNITARARLNVWMSSRALNGIQCITDGHAYKLDRVYEIKEGIRKPGMDILSNLERLERHKGIRKISLGNRDWKQDFEQKKLEKINQDLDGLVSLHLKKFWDNYDLSIQYDIEHKLSHTSEKIVFYKKAHYILKTLEGPVIYKIRGVKNPDQTIYKTFFESISNNLPYKISSIEELYYKTEKLISINDYFLSIRKKLKDESVELKIPGFAEKINSTFKLECRDFVYPNYKTYQKVEKEKKDFALELLHSSIQDILSKRYLYYKHCVNRISRNINKPGYK
uniref:DNA-directed DNA polymerase n=1 Tax=Mallomonas splendens TaxID=52552 RepID=A0A3G2QZN4_9STRA|nr:hypothetical protein [Mallomonas splendens]YP_009545464.1 hypothetical protein [Mallomonas splendens]AYO28596.1 hypothetical protein [Mallomonas splendens]AYO28618.1 hypothetical protein [Mallomonas splendens]